MEVIVGTFMFAVLLGLCVFTIVLSRENFLQKTYLFEVVFDDVMGLRDGDNVVVRGMDVGKIKRLVLKEDGVHVIAALLQPVALKSDYQIEVIATSVLGGRYLQISEGSADAAPLAEGAVVCGRKPHDLIALVSDVAADLKDITAKIARGEGSLGKFIYDDALYDDTRAIVGEIKTAIRERNLLANLEDGVANLNQITEKINSGEGTLGLLVNDDAIYVEAKKLITDTRMTVDDLRETSPIVTFSSIYFGAF
ncbi:MAG: MlaD family protein [Kiritimatiellae bacterium]|jgi:phospholipid/cholesterol/gamma-HCH transport system substrate-binding protein|nr:MlaD family protein [Kiritimatiellia bacterium]